MSITDELREWASANLSYKSRYDTLIAIADRIDQVHEEAVAAARSNGVTEYGSMVAREYVKLPVDADGVPIRVGDMVERAEPPLHPSEVLSMVLFDGGDWQIHVDELPNVHASYQPSLLRHHHEPTVEDVLADYRGAAIELHTEYLRTDMSFEDFSAAADRLDADYAKRLRLAGEGE